MKKTLLLCGIMLALTATLAQASALNFAFGNCPADGGTYVMTNTCGSNFGTAFDAVGSYSLTAEQPLFVGVEVVIDGQVHGVASLPDYWQVFNSGSCRATALSAAFTFAGQTQVNCYDEWSGQAAGGLAAFQTSTTVPANPNPDPTRFRIKLAAAVANPIDLPPGLEFYSFVLHMSNTGTTTCAGCADAATMVLNSIKSAQQDGSGDVISDAAVNNCVGWQATSSPTDCQATPTVNKSWGQVKSLYR